ncbi:MAG TPA: hypothetical protein VGP04_10195 [Pseudonocardiaceae bacterium]|nr:hypothetical protein [Pseudonocardiaceae bacterium]
MTNIPIVKLVDPAPLLRAMTLGHSVDQLAHHVLYVHPTLTEVLEQAYSICELITRYALVAGFSSTIFGRLTATRARREHRLQLPTVHELKTSCVARKAALSSARLSWRVPESQRPPSARGSRHGHGCADFARAVLSDLHNCSLRLTADPLVH